MCVFSVCVCFVCVCFVCVCVCECVCVCIKWMIIAYKRPMNLGNLLSHRDLASPPPPPPPPPPHIYMIRDMGGQFVCVFMCVLCVSLCVCVCVCVHVFLGYVYHAMPYVLLMPHEKIYTSHLNLHPTQFPIPTVLPCCFALPTRTRQKLLSTFYFEFLNSIFFFLSSPTGFHFLFAR